MICMFFFNCTRQFDCTFMHGNYICFIHRTKKLNRLNALIENEMRQNDILDRKIQNLNLNIQEQSMTKDLLFGEKEQERRNGR